MNLLALAFPVRLGCQVLFQFETHKHSGLFYINAYGLEIHPSPNPDYLAGLASHDVLVYSCGSLWTRWEAIVNLDVINVTLR